MRAFLYRIVITLINIFIPPLSVALLAGVEWDCTLNCILFFLGVLPSHVHGFYISCVYFHRRKKVCLALLDRLLALALLLRLTVGNWRKVSHEIESNIAHFFSGWSVHGVNFGLTTGQKRSMARRSEISNPQYKCASRWRYA